MRLTVYGRYIDFGLMSLGLMSALGQKATFAAQTEMSALPRIATAKVDSRNWACLL